MITAPLQDGVVPPGPLTPYQRRRNPAAEIIALPAGAPPRDPINPISSAQPLWLDVPLGSSFGLYPAIEITLHLDHVYAAQRRSPATVKVAFRALKYGTNLLPLRRLLAKRPAAV
jgi:hypothetical protein